MCGAEGPAPDLDLRDALHECARVGHSLVSSAISADVLRRLRGEIGRGPFRPFRESFGEVRQQIDGYDIPIPASGFPVLTSLCRDLRDSVRFHGRGVRGLASWVPHKDGTWYRRIVVVATVYGRAPFAICGSRDPRDVLERWIAGPGDLVLMRGPGLAGVRDGRPFHLVEGPRRGGRLSLGIRMSVRPPNTP
jgi:hypothetical protein